VFDCLPKHISWNIIFDISLHCKSIIENTYQIYLGGEFLTTKDHLKVYNPYNFEELSTTNKAGEAELEEAILKALSVASNTIKYI
jgi:hypothetical protein